MTATRRTGDHKVVSDRANRMHDEWWQRAVVYQVYPRAFQDTDGDGVGDLRGIRDRLDYLEWLGVDAVWLSPINRSPMADCGYDVASSQHPWYLDARSSRTAEHRDWYIWRDPLTDDSSPQGSPSKRSPPNGWTSFFGGSAWEWGDATGQYYFHSFLKEQPDLNWANPQVRAAMFDVMRWWFRRGVDGFRIDVVQLRAKRFELAPGVAGSSPSQQHWRATPAVHAIVRQLRAVAEQDLGRNDRAIAYLRISGDRRFLVAANLTSRPAQLPEAARQFAGRIVLSTTDSHATGQFQPAAGLQPNEAIVVLLD